jgi:hypothetical protein
MSNRRNFLKMITMAAVASVLPVSIPTTERLTIVPTGYAGIGVGGIERMRITSTGNVLLGITNPNTSLKVYV